MAWTHGATWSRDRFLAGSGSWQGPCSGSAGTPAHVLGPHIYLLLESPGKGHTTVPVRQGLQRPVVLLVKLGALHGLVQVPLGSDHVDMGWGTARAPQSFPYELRLGGRRVRRWRRKAESRHGGSTPVPCSSPTPTPPSSCGEALPLLWLNLELAPGWGPPPWGWPRRRKRAPRHTRGRRAVSTW